MRYEVFDQFPWRSRVAGLSALALVGVLIISSFPNYAVYSVIPFAACPLLLLVRNVLVIHYDRRTWSYRKGLWPLFYGRTGGFDELYGVEISKWQAENWSSERAGDDIYISSYSSVLYWKDESLATQGLYVGKSFGAVAIPTVDLARAMKIPIMLSRDMQIYGNQLAEYEAKWERFGTADAP